LETTKRVLGENPIDSKKRKERRCTSREMSQSLAVIKERTKEKTSSRNIHAGYFPSWYLYHDTSPIEEE
jgi:hypothetical protein